MNCELAHERIVLAAYGELPDEQMHELDRHLAACPECSHERQQLLALKTLATAYPVVEPDPNFVARARIRLEEALDALPPKRWYERLGQRILNNFASLQSAPVAACCCLSLEPVRGRWEVTSMRRPVLPMSPPRAAADPKTEPQPIRCCSCPGRSRQHLQHCSPAEQRDRRRHLQPGCATADPGFA